VTVVVIVRRPELAHWPLALNHSEPSGPVVMPNGPLLPLGRLYSLNTPAGVILPMAALLLSVNQRLPSGPVVICSGWLLAVGIANSVMVPLVLMRPILLPLLSTKPEGAVWAGVMPRGSLLLVKPVSNSVMVPLVVMRPILLPSCSGKHRLPSGPAVMP